jgi:prepilin-type N-terminal cleavage/methylation domain-containing protein
MVRSRSGLTLVEIMVAVVVLGLGTLLVQEGLLRSAGLFSRYGHTLKAQLWVDEKLWEARQRILYEDETIAEESGDFTADGRPYTWSLVVSTVGQNDLQSVSCSVAWREAGRVRTLTREIYVVKIKDTPV